MPSYEYTATGTGGRDGRVWSSTGSFDHQVIPAGSKRDGTTPEELIAGAWAACFGTTLVHVARSHGIDASAAVVAATIVFDADHENGRYVISRGELKAHVPGTEVEHLQPVMIETHAVCPVSKMLQAGVDELIVAPSDDLEVGEA